MELQAAATEDKWAGVRLELERLHTERATKIGALCPVCQANILETILDVSSGQLFDEICFDCPECGEPVEFVLRWHTELVSVEPVRQIDRDNLNWTEQ